MLGSILLITEESRYNMVGPKKRDASEVDCAIAGRPFYHKLSIQLGLKEHGIEDGGRCSLCAITCGQNKYASSIENSPFIFNALVGKLSSLRYIELHAITQ